MVEHGVLMDKMVSHGLKMGIFADVVSGQPKAAPSGEGLTLALWFGPMTPLAAESGLSASSMLQTVWARLYLLVASEQDVETTIMTAAAQVMAQLSMDISFGLDMNGVWTDLLGAYSPGVSAIPAYMKPDGTLFRIVEVRVPVVLEDFFSQGVSA